MPHIIKQHSAHASSSVLRLAQNVAIKLNTQAIILEDNELYSHYLPYYWLFSFDLAAVANYVLAGIVHQV